LCILLSPMLLCTRKCLKALDVNCFPLSCMTVLGLPLFIIQSSSTLITYVYRSFSFRPSSACYFPRTIIQATDDEIIPCTRIAKIERAQDVHLDHIIGVFHFKPLVFSSLKLTFEDVKTMSF
jgi:hypothetical protein